MTSLPIGVRASVVSVPPKIYRCSVFVSKQPFALEQTLDSPSFFNNKK
jgi:hypothetical protein